MIICKSDVMLTVTMKTTAIARGSIILNLVGDSLTHSHSAPSFAYEIQYSRISFHFPLSAP